MPLVVSATPLPPSLVSETLLPAVVTGRLSVLLPINTIPVNSTYAERKAVNMYVLDEVDA